jgi:hypothetical protein
VVAKGDHIGTGAEQPVGELRRDSSAVGGVLAVDDGEVCVVPLAQGGQVLLDGAATRDAEDVREEEDLQSGKPS